MRHRPRVASQQAPTGDPTAADRLSPPRRVWLNRLARTRPQPQSPPTDGLKMLRFLTAGESHGPELVAVVEGYPAGFDIDLGKINYDLARRQKGYGRGGRMAIERDEVRLVSGIRFGRSMGSPITLIVENRDFKNWQKRMSVDPADRGEADPVTRPRPGHADLAGVLKYNLDDIRDVLERASARETTMRVAAGSLAKLILEPFGVTTLGYVASIGSTEARTPADLSIEDLK